MENSGEQDEFDEENAGDKSNSPLIEEIIDSPNPKIVEIKEEPKIEEIREAPKIEEIRSAPKIVEIKPDDDEEGEDDNDGHIDFEGLD